MMKGNLFFKLRDAISEFVVLSRIALLNARDGLLMRLIERINFRPEACDLFVGLFDEKRIMSGFKGCAYCKKYERCNEAPNPKVCHYIAPNVELTGGASAPSSDRRERG